MNWPKQENILSKSKKLGFVVNGPSDNGQYWIIANGHVVSWYLQEGCATAFHCHRNGDDSDAMTDYSSGYFAHTIKSAMNSLSAEAR